jgi:hypothetical protein
MQRCPRSRYWGHHYQGTGITPKKRNPAFLVGSYVHKGIDSLVLAQPLSDVLDALKTEFDAEVAQLTLDVMESEQMDEAKKEAWWLITAALIVFERTGKPQLLADYDVFETEREETVELAPGLDFMARTDAILVKREDGDIYIGSWKTAASYDKRRQQDHAHDMQGVSEQAAVEPRLGKIMGVQMVHLIKGRKEAVKDENDNTVGYKLANALVYGWRRWNSSENHWQWAHSYWWRCSEPHVKSGKPTKAGPPMCEGGKKHRLSDDYERAAIAEEYPGGQLQWIEDITAGHIQPDAQETAELIGRYVVVPPPLFRHDWELRNWKEQTISQEYTVKGSLDLLEKLVDPNSQATLLNRAFPQFTHSCTYPSKCPFYAACWDNIGEPLESGLYEIRKPNHPQEVSE